MGKWRCPWCGRFIRVDKLMSLWHPCVAVDVAHTIEVVPMPRPGVFDISHAAGSRRRMSSFVMSAHELES